MQAVLISIRPKWLEKIASGEKTIEVRKTRPKMGTPFRCYIYCTRNGQDHDKLWVLNKQTQKEYDGLVAVCANLRECQEHHFLGNGKVIGEFTCSRVTDIFANGRFWLNEDDVRHTCLTADEIRTYANGANRLYGWRISDLKIYDKPLPLNAFKKWNRDCAYSDLGYAIPDCDKCTDSGCFVQKPPQSWCFVEELQ